MTTENINSGKEIIDAAQNAVMQVPMTFPA